MKLSELSDTKKKIVLASEQLFRQYGYEDTSMRMLADACGMAVGNLCYHFPKKEDLVMFDHNVLMDAFLGTLDVRPAPEDPAAEYVAAEYNFILRIARDAELLRMYREVINVPALRQEYYQKHHDLLLRFFSAADFGLTEHAFYMSTVAFCSLCYTIIEQYDGVHEEDLDELIRKTFAARFVFLGKDPGELTGAIDRGMAIGREQFELTSNKELFYGMLEA